jgi:2OG-Fe(II) oxygenase superfamily
MSMGLDTPRRHAVSINLGDEVIPYDHIVNPDLLARVDELHGKFVATQPFPHIVLDGFFSPTLLETVLNEFDSAHRDDWKKIESDRESIIRSRPDAELGPASRVYFDTLSSGRFIRFLSALTGIAGLLPDPLLRGGGLHETRSGGRFDVHLDFAKHSVTNLDNRLLLITYLNKDWLPAHGGALELWSASEKRCVVKVVPEFGRTVILRHSENSLHGHPDPIVAPDGRVRRSVAAYYYTNGDDDQAAVERYTTYFATAPVASRKAKLASALKLVLPPLIFGAGRLALRQLMQRSK